MLRGYQKSVLQCDTKRKGAVSFRTQDHHVADGDVRCISAEPLVQLELRFGASSIGSVCGWCFVASIQTGATINLYQHSIPSDNLARRSLPPDCIYHLFPSSMTDHLLPPTPQTHALPTLFNTTSPPPVLLSQGAEALLYRTHYLTPHYPSVLKYRPRKHYRHPTLDARLTRHRILGEARTLVKCRREGVPVPGVLGLDADGAGAALPTQATEERKDGQGGRESRSVERGGEGGWMMLEWIEGRTVKEVLQARRARRVYHAQARQAAEAEAEAVAETGGGAEVKVEIEQKGEEGSRAEQEGKVEERVDERELMRKIGEVVGRLHSVGVIHGDLTTSNMILRPTPPHTLTSPSTTADETTDHRPAAPPPASNTPDLPTAEASLDGSITLIDFGLSTQSLQDEDKAVDLYVLERAFASTHPEAEDGFRELLRAYGTSYGGAKRVLKRLEEVRGRGRKRSMVG